MSVSWSNQPQATNPMTAGNLTITGKPSAQGVISYPRDTGGSMLAKFQRVSGSENGPRPTSGIPVTNPSDTSAQIPVTSDFDKLIGFAQSLLGGGGSSGSGQPQYQIVPGSAGGGSSLGLLLILGGVGALGYYFYKEYKGRTE